MNFWDHPGFWIIVAIIGITLLVLGIVFFEINRRRESPQPTWVYVLIIAGAIIALAAFVGTLWAISNQTAPGSI